MSESAHRYCGLHLPAAVISHGRYRNHFRLRRHLKSAAGYRIILQERFHSWRQVAVVCPAAV